MAKEAYYAAKASHIIMFQDIYGGKGIEQALLKEEEKCRNLFNPFPDAISIIEEEGTHLTVNLAIAESFSLFQ